MSTIRRASSRAISISVGVMLGMGDAEAGHARLARAEDLAAAAQPQVLLGDAEAVLGLAHDAEAVAGDGAERRLVEEEADRRPVAPPDAAAELVELGEAEALGVLDDHDGRVGHVDADLDHGGGDEDADLAGEEARPWRGRARPASCGRGRGRRSGRGPRRAP